MRNKLCDLHVHSTFSDGTMTPPELIDLAIEQGLSALALCDHNTVTGLPLFSEYAEDKAIESVCGTELSTTFDGSELHILGLFITPPMYGEINEWLSEAMKRKQQSNFRMIAALNESGIHLDYRKLTDESPSGQFNRGNVAAAMKDLGYVDTISQAFREYLAPELGYYREPERPDACATIGFLRDLGAVPVWAHPFLSLPESRITEFLPQAVNAGLAGMEVLYSEDTAEETRKAYALADQYGLLYSGGTDFHGENKPDIQLGTGYGNMNIPYQYYLELREQRGAGL